MTKNLSPKEIVAQLDKFIIGQNAAKKAVAVALRNRWRRGQVAEDLRAEITPKNILMIGPTGVGKTEISRRIAKLTNAPFIKVEATKFTEVGYVGKEVESIIKDLADNALKMFRAQAREQVKDKAYEAAENRVLDLLIPPVENDDGGNENTRQLFRKRLREKQLDEKELEIDLPVAIGVEIMTPPGLEEMTSQLEDMFAGMQSKKTQKKKMLVKDILKVYQEQEADKLINEDAIRHEALTQVEQNGIVFIDEIDKVASRDGVKGADVSREGVQRDLLPLIEGSTVKTKLGMVKTDHILFICSGAFHLSKPSDLIPELQGRLPIRVELSSLTAEDFVRILTEPFASLTRQYSALLATENVDLKFSEDGIQRIAELAFEVNEKTENIGARRLHTIMEKLLEEISFDATEANGANIEINKVYVDKQLSDLVVNEDLSRYIL